ncbi:Clp protease N-terminal domain-containing protein [Nocardia sp. alder85J]|uniref:Clp protease N-terminal domain-containing protein n=1 Tax=Nocardia sp. alder85J TaxID=2862949 RepID=UPI001CD3D2AD|nr:Clp protease N-terminal domain-containing protein [Nocardia sp. alder85J]MCX4095352.1 hypothetical protein [Nocardia sp. alder85J]
MATGNQSVSLTPRMNWVLGYAEAVARERGHPEVGVDHLQLAVLHDPAAVPTQVLARLGGDRERLAELLNVALRAAAYRMSADRFEMLRAAGDIAVEFGHDHIGVEHLQLAILRLPGSVAVRGLAEAGPAPEVFAAELTATVRSYR